MKILFYPAGGHFNDFMTISIEFIDFRKLTIHIDLKLKLKIEYSYHMKFQQKQTPNGRIIQKQSRHNTTECRRTQIRQSSKENMREKKWRIFQLTQFAFHLWGNKYRLTSSHPNEIERNYRVRFSVHRVFAMASFSPMILASPQYFSNSV